MIMSCHRLGPTNQDTSQLLWQQGQPRVCAQVLRLGLGTSLRVGPGSSLDQHLDNDLSSVMNRPHISELSSAASKFSAQSVTEKHKQLHLRKKLFLGHIFK